MKAKEWTCLLKPSFVVWLLCLWKSGFCGWWIDRGFSFSFKLPEANPHIEKDGMTWKALECGKFGIKIALAGPTEWSKEHLCGSKRKVASEKKFVGAKK